MPDVRHRKLAAPDRYLILACDGIWERASNQDVATFLLEQMEASEAIESKDQSN